MQTQTALNNVHYATIGDVTMHFTDGSSVTKNIDTIGMTVFATDGRILASMDAMGQTFNASGDPIGCIYPDNSKGFAYTVYYPGDGIAYPPWTLSQLDCY